MIDEDDQEAALTSSSTLTSLFTVSDIDGSDEINCTYTIESDGTELVASTEVVDPSDISSILQHKRLREMKSFLQ